MPTARSNFVLLVSVLLVLGWLSVCALGGRDFYQLLGVSRDADKATITRAYRKLARTHHPDHSKLDKDAAEKKFAEIATAYETLSDETKRREYDQFGEAGAPGARAGRGAGGGGGGFTGGFNFDFGSMFGFGGAGGGRAGGGGPRQRGGFNTGPPPPPPPPPTVELPLTLEEIFRGGSKTISVTNRGKSQKVSVEVPAGVKAGETLEADGFTFAVVEKKHARFERKGTSLYTKAKITLQQALTGGTVTVKGIDGVDVSVAVPPGKVLSPKSKESVGGAGFPIQGSRTGKRGELFVSFDIAFPQTVSDADRAAISAMNWNYAS